MMTVPLLIDRMILALESTNQRHMIVNLEEIFLPLLWIEGEITSGACPDLATMLPALRIALSRYQRLRALTLLRSMKATLAEVNRVGAKV